MSKQLLIDSIDASGVVLTEDKGTGKTVARGPYAVCGVPTENGRVYGRKLYEDQIRRLEEKMGKRRCYGELDHPADGKTKLQRASHLITKLWFEGDTVMGEAEILNTPNGKILKNLFNDGCGVGISSRGFGTTTPGMKKGTEEVNTDFVLKTFDFVADPASKEAYPNIFAESEGAYEFTADMLRDEFPALVEELEESITERLKRELVDGVDKVEEDVRKKVEAELTEKFEKRVIKELAEMREEVKASLQEQYESDPQVGGAKALIVKIAEMVTDFVNIPEDEVVRDALKAKDLEIEKLKNEASEATEAGKIIGFKLILERELVNNSMAKTVKNLVGDLAKYNSIDELRKKISDISEGFERAVGEEKKLLEDENKKMRKKIQDLKLRLRDASKMEEKLTEEMYDIEDDRKTEKLNRYKAERASQFRNSRKLMRMLENAADEAQVDEIIEEHGSRKFRDRRLESVRSKEGRGIESGIDLLADNPENETGTLMGYPLKELKHLAGMD